MCEEMQNQFKVETTSELRARLPINQLPENTEDEKIYRFLYGDSELERRALSYCENLY